MELSHFGAKVIYPPTLQPITEKKIPVYIKNTFKPDDAGTLITHTTEAETVVRFPPARRRQVFRGAVCGMRCAVIIESLSY